MKVGKDLARLGDGQARGEERDARVLREQVPVRRLCDLWLVESARISGSRV